MAIALIMILPLNIAKADATEEKVIIQLKDNNKESDLLGEIKSKNDSHEFENIDAIVVSVTEEERTLLENDESIEVIEEDTLVTISSSSFTWGLEKINIQNARQSNLSGTGIKVAVIDTGVAPNHQYVKLSGGKSFVPYTSSYKDDHGHGTHVAGTIAAQHNQVNQHSGVAPNVALYSLKALNQDGRGNISDIISAIDWTISNQIDIINLSFGTQDDVSALKEILAKAYEKGILIVASSGNVGTNVTTIDNVQYPAKYSSVISVAATNSSNKRALFSSTGPTVEVSAPGENIYSTSRNNSYHYMDGTSMASGFVAGNLALLKEAYPQMDNITIRKLLQSQAIDLGVQGRDNEFGYGIIQAPLIKETFDYFKVVDTRTPIYDNSTGSLLKVGELEKGQIYPRTRNYGNWHEIKFGNGKGYVRKTSTVPASSNGLQNLNNGTFRNSSRSFLPRQNVVVYDNSSGSLIPFARLIPGSSYPIVSDYGNWWRVDVAGRIGYVSKALVNVNFTSDMKYFEVTAHGVPIYDNSTGRLVKVGELTKGQVYPRVRDYGNWHEINYGNSRGYVSKAATAPVNRPSLRNENTSSIKNSNKTFKALQNTIVYDNSTGSLIPFAVIEKGQAYPIMSDYGNWWRVDVSGRIGYVRKNTVQLSFSASTSYFKVIVDQVPVYDNSSGRLVKIGELRNGQVYPRVRDYGNWHEIKYGQGRAYVLKSNTIADTGNSLRNLNNGSYSISNTTCRTNRASEVYDNSSGGLVPFATLENSISYPIVSNYGNWWRIDVADRIGYIRKLDVHC